jgi:hypothetical protein
MSYREGLPTLYLALLAFFASGCAQQPEGWIPVLEETSVHVLQTKTKTVMAHLQIAREKLRTDPHGAEEALDLADEELKRFSAYTLPLLDARERSYNAYRLYYLGEEDNAAGELDRIEKILVSMAEDGGPPLARELEKPLEMLADAKAAIAADPAEAPEFLRELATRLNLMFLKIELVLGDTR